MKLGEIFPSRFVKGEDIAGKRLTLTIRGLTMEEMGKDKEVNPVLWFEGAQKGLVLNKTNATTIGSLYGDEIDDWRGKRIILYTEQTRIGGENKTVIKVAKQVPEPPMPKAPPPLPPDTPAPKVSEDRRLHLKKIADLAMRHDTLFDEGTDVSMLVAAMRDADEDDEEMPVTPAKGKAHSMYSYLLECIDNVVGVDGCAEEILSYLLGRVITGVTPPKVAHRFLLDDLMPEGAGEWVDAVLATYGCVLENVN